MIKSKGLGFKEIRKIKLDSIFAEKNFESLTEGVFSDIDEDILKNYESFVRFLNSKAFPGEEFNKDVANEIFKPIYDKKKGKRLNQKEISNCFKEGF